MKPGDLVKIIHSSYLGTGIVIKHGVLIKELDENDEDYLANGSPFGISPWPASGLWRTFCDGGFKIYAENDLEVVK